MIFEKHDKGHIFDFLVVVDKTNCPVAMSSGKVVNRMGQWPISDNSLKADNLGIPLKT